MAQLYRAALIDEAPDVALRLDDELRRRGQGWVCPRLHALDPDELVAVPMAAELCGVSERTIDMWRYRGLRAVTTEQGVRYRVGDLTEHQAGSRRRRREQRAG